MVTDSDTNIVDLWDKTLIPAFEKANPDITLKLTTANSSDETALFARIAASVHADKAPPVDVFVDSEFIPQASEAGLLYPALSTLGADAGGAPPRDERRAGRGLPATVRTSMPTTRLDKVSKRLGGRDIISDLDLEIAPGELVCLLGPSGCGKTTTLRMIGGFVTPDSGTISPPRGRRARPGRDRRPGHPRCPARPLPGADCPGRPGRH
jgi:ABC-type glutathione transport system ATPase component